MMRALNDVSIVFEASVASLGDLFQAEDWTIIFAGHHERPATIDGHDRVVDGRGQLRPAGRGDLTTSARGVHARRAREAGDNAFFRLGFIVGGRQPDAQIDNVTISGDVTLIPEPGTAALLLLGLTGLGMAGRRRA